MKIGFLEGESYVLAAIGVEISRQSLEISIKDIYEECNANKQASKDLVNAIINKYNHFILADFLPYAITLENISRLAAIYFWRNVNALNLVFGAGIETSFREVKPTKYNEVVGDFGKQCLEVYKKAVNLGVLEQDARYMIPQGALTRIIFSAPPRYLKKIAVSLKDTPLPELQKIGKEIEKIVEKKFDLKIPKETSPSKWEFWGQENIKQGVYIDYGEDIHSISMNMGIKGSLSMYAQLVRQRQNLCCIEPLEGISRKATFVVPNSFPKSMINDYAEIAALAKAKQAQLLENRDPNFVYFLLLGQEAESMVYGKGAGVIETANARSEGVASAEIRTNVGIPITRKLARYPVLQKQIGPKCWRKGKCTEPATFRKKKNVCPAFSMAGGNWKGMLKELLNVLEEPYEVFTVILE